ncbi:MAG: T9SS type A sorting domain-containing protein, partial [Balneolaceae bacterium]|nr:T9SS type A sorting domain-containing protein [Balneolaceae bacterium]
KEIKLTIADYRPTTVDAPVLSVDQEAVTASMNREEQLEVPLTLSNTGASNLMWRVATEPVGLSKTRTLSDMLSQETILPKRVFNFVEKLNSNHVFNETFEGFESSSSGYYARQGWRTQSLDDVFAIKTNNPSSGQKHLQIQASEESSYWVRSPFFGPQLEGTFEVSFDLSITKDSNTDGFNAVDLKFYDGVNGTLAAGVAVNSDLQFQTYHRSEQGGATTTKNTGEYFESNTSGNDSYRTVRIKLNATTSRIEYYLDDVLVDESYYLSADVLDIFYITVYGNTHPLGLVDIDNFEVQRPYIVEWLDIDDVAGAIDPGSQGTLNLSFNTVGVDAGVYQIKLQLLNNSQSSTVDIPITLTVSNQIESVGRVSLSTPSDGSSGLALTPTLSWNEDANADSYSLQISTDGFNSFVVNESLSGTSYSTSDLEYNTEYSWRVRGSNSSEDGDWSEVWTFTTKADPTINPPGTPSLSTPTNGADDVLRPIAFSWAGAARAETYTLEVSEDDFATVALRTTTSSTSYSTSSLAYKTSYSWRVKATNEAGDGDWSEVYTFAMGTPPSPGVVSLSSPANNASGLSNKPTLQWDIEPYAYAYDVQVSKDEFERLEVSQTTEGTSLSPSVDYNQSYSWRVRATNETGVGEWSATRTFATEDAPAPGVTTLSFPSDASTDIAPDTSFVWQPTTYASSYVIEIRTDADELTTDTVKTTSYAMSLDNATSYSWRVKAFNSKGSGAWSDTWSFTTVAKPIEAIQTLRPTNDAGNVSTSPTFVWQADSNAASYQLQLSEDGFDSMYEQTSTTDTNATVGGLAHRSTYSWRVRGVNTGIKGAWSEPFTFTTQPPSVSVPIILAPAQNADSVTIPTEFVWQADENATSYQAELFTDAFTVKVFGQSLTDTSIVYTEMVADKGYLFRVRAVNAAGTSNWRNVEFRTAEQDVNTSISSSAIPTEYSLGQNYPNPFNPATTIQYSLPVGSYVSLRVYNMLGQKVETLVDGVKSAGYHQVTFDGSNLSSGSYIYRLETGEYAQMRTMFLVK